MPNSSYSVTINPSNVKTPCTGYYLYTGTTQDINSAVVLNNGDLVTFASSGYTLSLSVDSSYDSIFLFIEHCDGHVDSVPSSTPKKQGGYQVMLVDLRCETCSSVPSPTTTPAPTSTASPTSTPVPTATDSPTSTPSPTDGPTSTPAPTATEGPTSTPAPTSTDNPTSTPVPTPTETPSPTDGPTSTPAPTSTEVPTSTPVPTPTPTVTSSCDCYEYTLTNFDTTSSSTTITFTSCETSGAGTYRPSDFGYGGWYGNTITFCSQTEPVLGFGTATIINNGEGDCCIPAATAAPTSTQVPTPTPTITPTTTANPTPAPTSAPTSTPIPTSTEAPCNCYSIFTTAGEGGNVSYTSCAGEISNISVSANVNYQICSQTTPVPSSGDMVITNKGLCTNGSCPPSTCECIRVVAPVSDFATVYIAGYPCGSNGTVISLAIPSNATTSLCVEASSYVTGANNAYQDASLTIPVNGYSVSVSFISSGCLNDTDCQGG